MKENTPKYRVQVTILFSEGITVTADNRVFGNLEFSTIEESKKAVAYIRDFYQKYGTIGLNVDISILRITAVKEHTESVRI